MSIFGSITGKIFGHADVGTSRARPGDSARAVPSSGSFNNPAWGAPSPGRTEGGLGSSGASAARPQSRVDVDQILTEMAARKGQALDWRQSIVDLLRLLDLDDSQPARQALARELNYSGSADDAAAMNAWLHAEVMRKLRANGGRWERPEMMADRPALSALPSHSA